MKLAALGIFGAVLVGVCAMGCSPKTQQQAKAPAHLDSWEQMMDRNGDVATSTTTLTNAMIKGEPTKKLLIPYVNFDELDGDDSSASGEDNLVLQTWGAPYQAYEGYDEKLGF